MSGADLCNTKGIFTCFLVKLVYKSVIEIYVSKRHNHKNIQFSNGFRVINFWITSLRRYSKTQAKHSSNDLATVSTNKSLNCCNRY